MLRRLAISIIALGFLSFFQEKPQLLRKEKAFDTYIKDSIPIRVDLIYADEQPHQYFSLVRTPVCEDDLCYLITIEIYWDLLGNFIKYELPPQEPLTKFDHIEFSEDDYTKLNEILADRGSLLKDYEAKDLVDPTTSIKSEVEVDAVTSATYASLKGAVVSGAVYSTHTLWHIVNGRVAQQILQHTESLYDDQMLTMMLNSDHFYYQYYALEHMPAVVSDGLIPGLIRLVAEGQQYIPYFAVEKFPEKVWQPGGNQSELIALLPDVAFEMQNTLLARLKDQKLNEQSALTLISTFNKFNDEQLHKALTMIYYSCDSLSTEVLLEFSYLLTHQNQEISALAYRILERRSDESENIQKVLSAYEN